MRRALITHRAVRLHDTDGARQPSTVEYHGSHKRPPAHDAGGATAPLPPTSEQLLPSIQRPIPAHRPPSIGDSSVNVYQDGPIDGIRIVIALVIGRSLFLTLPANGETATDDDESEYGITIGRHLRAFSCVFTRCVLTARSPSFWGRGANRFVSRLTARATQRRDCRGRSAWRTSSQ